MRSREERERERREYEADVAYAVWRSGGNPDRVDHDRVLDHYYDGRYSDEAARSELRRMRPPEPEPEPEPEQQEEA